MNHRFIIYSFSHTILVVDITEIGLPTEIYPPDGKRQLVPTLRFQSWRDVEQHLSSLGADAEVLGNLHTIGLSVLTIA